MAVRLYNINPKPLIQFLLTTEAVLDLVDPDVPGGGEAEEGEEREQLHDEQCGGADSAGVK